jgi:D-glycero-D-manno-heptose 1,7-bisphosphate phosphatase
VRAAAFLDRDGVLNRPTIRAGRPHPPHSLEDVELLPGVVEACAELRDADIVLIVVTNQPDIARRSADPAVVRAINDTLQSELAIDEVAVCPHDDSDECRCRKPRPGLLLDAAARWDVDLSRSSMVGDRWRDIEAGRAAGVATVFLDRNYAERPPERPDLVADELIEAVPFLLERAGIRR